MGYTVRPASPVIRPETPVIRPSSPVIRPSAPVVHPGAGAAAPAIPLTTGLQANLHYDVGVTVDGSDRLTAWEVESGPANHCNIFSATAPLLTAGGIHIDAAARYAGRSTLLGGALSDNVTVYMVSQVLDVSGTKVLCQTASDSRKAIRVVSGQWAVFDLGTNPGGTADTVEHRFGGRFGPGATDDALFIDGVNVTGDGSASSVSGSNGFTVSRADGFGAQQIVKTYILFDVRHDDTDMATMMAYLAARHP